MHLPVFVGGRPLSVSLPEPGEQGATCADCLHRGSVASVSVGGGGGGGEPTVDGPLVPS